MRWVEHVVHVEDFRNVYKILVRKYKEKNFLEGTGVVLSVILQWILKK
jgi:hypothetical protein